MFGGSRMDAILFWVLMILGSPVIFLGPMIARAVYRSRNERLCRLLEEEGRQLLPWTSSWEVADELAGRTGLKMEGHNCLHQDYLMLSSSPGGFRFTFTVRVERGGQTPVVKASWSD